MSFNQFAQPNQANPIKYKTMLCKHFNSPKGCSFGEKCQFAHGPEELRNQGGLMNMPAQKKGPNPNNYKIVKCKYWEKDGTCRYGTLCSFAHGDAELRTKTENMALNNDGGQSPMYGMNGMAPMAGIPAPYMMGFDPNMMMGMMNFQGNPEMMNGMFMPPIGNNFMMPPQQPTTQKTPSQNGEAK